MANRLLQMEQELTKKRKVREKKRVRLRRTRNAMQQSAYAWPFGSIDYTVPGIVAGYKQPTRFSCWAAVTASMTSWVNDQSYETIEDALKELGVGSEFINLFNKGQVLNEKQFTQFIAQAGMETQSPTNFTIEGWEGLLRQYGPLVICSDMKVGPGMVFHARVLTAIKGDGTSNGTYFTLFDPKNGKASQESFGNFLAKYEEIPIFVNERDKKLGKTTNMPLQIWHWPKNAKLTRAKSVSYSIPYDYAAPFDQSKIYEVPGIVPEVKQDKSMACWATCAAMLQGWSDSVCYTIPGALKNIGKKWLDIYNADTGLNRGKKVNEFVKETDFEAAPIANFSVEGWRKMLEDYGPLWVAIDTPVPGVVHDIVVTGIGDDGTSLSIKTIDPSTGKASWGPFSAFVKDYEGIVEEYGLLIQVIHLPARAVSQEYHAMGNTPNISNATRPWKDFFHFTSGTSFKVKGSALLVISIRGKGKVDVNSGNDLTFTLDIPHQSVPGGSINKSLVKIELKYTKEGAGNYGCITINGTPYIDKNLTIKTKGNRRYFYPSISLFGKRVQEISVEKDGANEIDLDIDLDGLPNIDFDLTK